MASKAITAQGTTISVSSDGGTTYNAISEVNNFSGIGGGSASVIDVTSFASTAKEKRMGLKDEGQVKLDMKMDPTNAGQSALKSARNAQTEVTIKVELDNSLGVNGTTWTFNGYVLTFEQSGGVDAVVDVSTSIEITGAITETAAA